MALTLWCYRRVMIPHDPIVCMNLAVCVMAFVVIGWR